MSATALVTGAAGGIGRATALELARQGWKVAACDLNGADETVALLESDAISVAFDVRDAGATRSAYERIESELGPVAAVVANAGVADRLARAATIDPEAWRAELEVNLTGAFLSLQPALAGMKERGGGRVVVVSSIAATDGLAGQVAYSAAKAGLLGMVRTVALEMAASGTTANAVLPGMIGTEKVEAMPEEIKERSRAAVPMRRFALPRRSPPSSPSSAPTTPPTSPAPGSPSTAASASPTSPWAAKTDPPLGVTKSAPRISGVRRPKNAAQVGVIR